MTAKVWGWALLGALGWTLVYADRAIFGPLLVPIGHTFAVGPAALGLLSAAFFASYTLLQIPVGVLADRKPPRVLLALSFVGFGGAVALSAAAPAFIILVATVFVSGAFQSVYYPAQYAATARTVPRHLRDRATAVVNGGMGIGVALGFGVGAAPFFLGHWQILLAIAGGVTMVAAVPFFLLAPKEPAQRAKRPGRIPLSRDLLLLCAANFGSLFGFFFFLTWFPYYLETTALVSGGLLVGLSAVAPLISAPAGVIWTRILGERRLLGVRIFLPAAALSLAVVPFIRSPLLLFVPLVAYGLVGKLPTDPLILGETASRLPAESLGAGFGILNFAGMLASIAAPAISGLLAERAHDLGAAFLLSAVLLVLSLVATLFLSRRDPHSSPAAGT